MVNVNIVSLNVRGIANQLKRYDVFNYLKAFNGNIFCLQDIHCKLDWELEFQLDWGSEALFASRTSNSRGVGILFKQNFQYKIHKVIKDVENGNFIIIDIEMNEQQVSLVNIYGPNQDDPNFFENIAAEIEELDNASVIIVGDWNLVLEQHIDTKNYRRENNVRARNQVKAMIQHFDLKDIWRLNNLMKRRYTWKQKNPMKMARLDFFLVTEDIKALTKGTDILYGYKTDHNMITLEIDNGNQERGRGFWKFNTSLLKDEIYLHKIKQLIKINIQRYAIGDNIDNLVNVRYTISDQLLFDTIKMEIRGETIKYSTQKKKERDRREQNLIEEINKLEQEVDGGKNNLLPQLNQKQTNLEEIRAYKLRGVMLRANAQSYEQGEKPSRYFCSLEKKKYVCKTINKLNMNGNMIYDPKVIIKEQKKYYENLYENKYPEILNENEFLHINNIKQLTEEQKVSCEGQITLDEIKKVIKSSKNNKSPGCDGLPWEFYKVFYTDISILLQRALNDVYLQQKLSITQSKGIITCLPKGDKPREFFRNWRPITLLCVDYKILSGVMANRIKNVLPNIIGNDQKGFVKDRFIGENTRLLYDIIDYMINAKKTALLLLIDFEQAFDSLKIDYIRKVLKKYNFGEMYIKWFNIIYKDVTSCVINNGLISEFFKLHRGCRQGDPWSPYLFILSVEPLAQAIINSDNIRELTIKNKIFKIGQYADDTFLLLDGKENSLTQSINLLNRYARCSGLKLNIDKTNATWLGNKVNSPHIICPELNLKWVTQFKLLGIYYTADLKNMEKLNFDDKLLKAEKLLKQYSKRHLSLIGKVCVIKTLIVPMFVHVLTILPTPKKHFFYKIQPNNKNIFVERRQSNDIK